MPRSFSINGGTLVTPTKVLPGRSVGIEGANIAGLTKRPRSASPLDIALAPGTLVFPALLNIHDHMRGNYLPKVGPSNGHFYTNWDSWNDDLQASTAVGERNRALSIADIYELSSYKNILSGVVTVQDHFPHEWNEPFKSRQPASC